MDGKWTCAVFVVSTAVSARRNKPKLGKSVNLNARTQKISSKLFLSPCCVPSAPVEIADKLGSKIDTLKLHNFL